MENINIEKPCLILVEGETELSIFKKLTKQLLCQEFVQIICCSGINNYEDKLKNIKIASGSAVIKRLCMVRDAEGGEHDAFGEIKKAIENADFPCPTEIGKWFGTEELKTTVFILPGEGRAGNLETLILGEVEKLKASGNCRESYFGCMSKIGEIKFDTESVANTSKFHVHAWCLAQKNVDDRVGSCFEKGLFTLPTLEKIIKFAVEGLA